MLRFGVAGISSQICDEIVECKKALPKQKEKNPQRIQKKENDLKDPQGVRYLRALLFSILDTTTRDVLTHEMGHAMAAKALFQGADLSITIFPFEGGVTQWIPWRGMTDLGRHFGEKNSRLIVSGAGAGFSFIFSLANILQLIRQKSRIPKQAPISR